MNEPIKQTESWYKTYLREYYEEFQELKKGYGEEDSLFSKFKKNIIIDPLKSYYAVCSDNKILRKFACYYLLSDTVDSYESISNYTMTERINLILSGREKEIEQYLLQIIYKGTFKETYGGQEVHLMTRVVPYLNTRINDEPKRLVLFLTEVDVPVIRNNCTFEIIDLNNIDDPTKFISHGVDDYTIQREKIDKKHAQPFMSSIQNGNIINGKKIEDYVPSNSKSAED